jgi:hypothetical protein
VRANIEKYKTLNYHHYQVGTITLGSVNHSLPLLSYQLLHSLFIPPCLALPILSYLTSLYQAVKRSIFKPGAFFKGLLLPLAEEGSACSLREAIIFSSILAKCSIPVIQSSVALLRLCQMRFSGAQTLFMKTLLNKKYSLVSAPFQPAVCVFVVVYSFRVVYVFVALCAKKKAHLFSRRSSQ